MSPRNFSDSNSNQPAFINGANSFADAGLGSHLRNRRRRSQRSLLRQLRMCYVYLAVVARNCRIAAAISST
jgi:hypothetical protein